MGVLLVERLSDARRNGHEVLAIVRGSAVNQDGASNGLTAPNGPSQQRVIRQALVDARLGSADVDVVEAHGTGTTLGDPIEAQALLATYGQEREEPLLLGSVKSNIGHTQAAAGVAGVIKMVLAMREGVVPATLHVDEPSPHIDWTSGAVELAIESRPWPVVDRARRAAVSSFGISGTNAHVIIELPEDLPTETAEPETAAGRSAGLVASDVVVWAVSGRSKRALAGQAARLARHVRAHGEVDAAAVGWSLAATRSVFDQRAAVVGSSVEELLAGLDALASGSPAGNVVAGTAMSHGAGAGAGAVFVFPGQGAQSARMAAGLVGRTPVFDARLAECQGALAPYLDVDLVSVLTGDDESWLARVEVVQPVLWAVGMALAAVWQHAGVTPAAVVLVPWGVEHYASGTAQAVLDHARPGARLVFSCGWHITRDGKDVYTRRFKVYAAVFGRLAKLARVVDVDDQVEACRRIFASDTSWTVVRGSDLEEGGSQGLPVWSRHVGDPILASNLTRRVDYARFMVEAVENDALVHEAPAIVGRLTPSALAHAAGPA